jgi:polar amino acid transport system substrate-binding protein
MMNIKVACFFLSCLFFSTSAATLKVCIDHYPPSQTLSGGPKGINIELLDALGELLDHDIEYIPGPNFARCLRMLELGQVDVLAGILDIPARREFAQLIPYGDNNDLIFVSRIDMADIVHFDDLKKYNVGTIKGIQYFKAFELEPSINKVLIKDIVTGVKMLLINRIDVIITSEPVLRSIEKELGNTKDKIKINPYNHKTTGALSFALSKKSQLKFTSKDIFKIKQAVQQQVFSKIIEEFVIAHPEIYAKPTQ